MLGCDTVDIRRCSLAADGSTPRTDVSLQRISTIDGCRHVAPEAIELPARLSGLSLDLPGPS